MINKAKWITAGEGITAPIMIKKFKSKTVAKAKLSVTGLGYFLCKINGLNVSEDKFMPVFSDYRKRDFSALLYPIHDKEFTHRVYYLEFDVAWLLREGENSLEIRLGNGWYNQTKRTVEGNLSFGQSLPARYALELTFLDGSEEILLSDGSEYWKESEILENNIFYGEIHDYRHINKGEWKKVQILPDFQTLLTLQTCPNERVIRTLTPKLVKDGNVKVFDVGEVLTGWAKLCVKGNSGDKITVVYANLIDQDGTLDTLTTGAYMQNDKGEYQLQKDEFVLDGKERQLAPKFSRYCFRYFEISGNIDAVSDVCVEVVHTDNPVASEFSSSNDVLNWIYQAFVRTELCNMHDGFPSDCPHRERLGYTGDGQMTAMSSMLTLSARSFYEKWIQDIVDGQNLKNGHVQYTAPFMGGGGGPGGWGGAIVFVIYAFYKRYGDLEMVKKYFGNMLKYVEYMQAHSQNGLVTSAEEGCWCLGDWASQSKPLPAPELVNTVLFIIALDNLCEMASAIDYKCEKDLGAIKSECKKAIEREFFDKQTCSFDGGVTGADAFCLYVGLGNQQTLKNLVQKYSALGKVDTGFIGAYYLIKTLFENDQTDLAYDLLTTTKNGSWGYMMEQGATTINEHLDMGRYVSDCHPMFGSVCELLFTHILGLQVGNSKDYNIRPRIPTELQNAKGSIIVDGHKVSVGFSKEKQKVIFTVNIPTRFNATLIYGDKAYSLSEGKNVIKI